MTEVLHQGVKLVVRKGGLTLRTCAAFFFFIAFLAGPSAAEIVPHIPVPQVHVRVPKIHVGTPTVHAPTSGTGAVHLSTSHVHLPASRPTVINGLAKNNNLKGPRPHLTASGWNGRQAGNKQTVPGVQKTEILPGASGQKQSAGVEKSGSNMKTASTTTNSSNSGGQQIFDPGCYSGGSCGGCFASNSCIIASYPSGSTHATCVANCGRIPSLPVSIQCGTFGICGPVATAPPPPVSAPPPTLGPNPAAPARVVAGFPLPNGGQTQACAICVEVGILAVITAGMIIYRYMTDGESNEFRGWNSLSHTITDFGRSGDKRKEP